VSLEIIECQDRRLARAAAELVAGITANGETEVSVLVPRRQYTHFWHRLLHDHSANAINETLSNLPHCSVTIVPYQLKRRASKRQERSGSGNGSSAVKSGSKKKQFDHEHVETPDGCLPIVEAQPRQHVRLAGRVRALRVQPLKGVPTLECTVVDSTGEMVVVFLGRREIAGVKIGTRLAVEGTVGTHLGKRAILNPPTSCSGSRYRRPNLRRTEQTATMSIATILTTDNYMYPLTRLHSWRCRRRGLLPELRSSSSPRTG